MESIYGKVIVTHCNYISRHGRFSTFMRMTWIPGVVMRMYTPTLIARFGTPIKTEFCLMLNFCGGKHFDPITLNPWCIYFAFECGSLCILCVQFKDDNEQGIFSQIQVYEISWKFSRILEFPDSRISRILKNLDSWKYALVLSVVQNVIFAYEYGIRGWPLLLQHQQKTSV